MVISFVYSDVIRGTCMKILLDQLCKYTMERPLIVIGEIIIN
jgi:hypothetical protein